MAGIESTAKTRAGPGLGSVRHPVSCPADRRLSVCRPACHGPRGPLGGARLPPHRPGRGVRRRDQRSHAWCREPRRL